MSRTIHLLDDALVDQIAAGEVVERPASVVKELLDNALDAGAMRITVELEDGGVGLIRVVDDGRGMTPDDVVVAPMRHATSKLRSFEDLSRLATLGFRGEALASISSVSRFRITTRQEDADAAIELRVDGGSKPKLRAVSGPVGTTVEVRDLFYNVPARRKFLKAAATEVSHVVDVVLRAALNHHDKLFRLRRDGRVVKEFLPQASLEERVRSVLDPLPLARVFSSHGRVSVDAFLGAPETAKSGAAQLHLFVNGRPIRDRALARAVTFAYGSSLAAGRYPAGVLVLELPPEDVDVNVHPQKTEVRFAKPNEILETVAHALRDGLADAEWNRGRAGSAERDPVSKTTTGWLREALATTSYGRTEKLHEPEPKPHAQTTPSLLIAQLRHGTLVVEDEEGLSLFDPHALLVATRASSYLESLDDGTLESKRLLFPERVTLDATTLERLSKHEDELRHKGFEIARVGPAIALVHAVPVLFDDASPLALATALAAGLTSPLEELACSLACAAAPMAPRFSREKIDALAHAFPGVDVQRFRCKHGTPLRMRLEHGELDGARR